MLLEQLENTTQDNQAGPEPMNTFVDRVTALAQEVMDYGLATYPHDLVIKVASRNIISDEIKMRMKSFNPLPSTFISTLSYPPLGK